MLLVLSYLLFFCVDFQVQNVIEKPHNDHLHLIEASRSVTASYL